MPIILGRYSYLYVDSILGLPGRAATVSQHNQSLKDDLFPSHKNILVRLASYYWKLPFTERFNILPIPK